MTEALRRVALSQGEKLIWRLSFSIHSLHPILLFCQLKALKSTSKPPQNDFLSGTRTNSPAAAEDGEQFEESPAPCGAWLCAELHSISVIFYEKCRHRPSLDLPSLLRKQDLLVGRQRAEKNTLQSIASLKRHWSAHTHLFKWTRGGLCFLTRLLLFPVEDLKGDFTSWHLTSLFMKL